MKSIAGILIKYGILSFVVGLMALTLSVSFIFIIGRLMSPNFMNQLWVMVPIAMGATVMAAIAFAKLARLSYMLSVIRQAKPIAESDGVDSHQTIADRVKQLEQLGSVFNFSPADKNPCLAYLGFFGKLSQQGNDPVHAQKKVYAAYGKLDGIPEN